MVDGRGNWWSDGASEQVGKAAGRFGVFVAIAANFYFAPLEGKVPDGKTQFDGQLREERERIESLEYLVVEECFSVWELLPEDGEILFGNDESLIKSAGFLATSIVFFVMSHSRWNNLRVPSHESTTRHNIDILTETQRTAVFTKVPKPLELGSQESPPPISP